MEGDVRVKYVNIYAWEILDKVKEGKVVYILDRTNKETYCTDSLTVVGLADILSQDNTGGRFVFWYEEGEETDNG